MATDPQREFLRHTLATLVYRAQKPLDNAPADFGSTRAAAGCRSAGEVLAHIGDLLDWALSMAKGATVWKDSPPMGKWDDEAQRFYAAAAALDEYLTSASPLACDARKLFQGPIADALTHVGQLATLRRLAGAPVRGENYFKAQIEPGRVGPDQSSRRVEFD